MNYIISDIHGNLRRFRSVLEQIKLREDDTLYILGDVIDRHPDGIQILREIMEMSNAKMLLGNHEYMMLRALGEPYDGPEDIAGRDPEDLLDVWYANRGGVTHQAFDHAPPFVQTDILDYLKALPLGFDITVNGQQYKLVHGAQADLYEKFGAEHESRTHFAVWERRAVLALPDVRYITIFGHTPTSRFQNADPLRIWFSENAIGMDCGSGFPDCIGERGVPVQGRLGCLRLEDMQEFYSEEAVRQSPGIQ